MKFKLLRDILVYLVIPILLFNATIINNQQTAFQLSCSIAIIYSIFTKIKENRINITGVFTFFILFASFLSSISVDSDKIYFYNTCILLFIALLVPILKLFNKNISIIVIKDMLKSLNKNTLGIIRLLKKKTIMNEINKISYMVETNLILMSLLRIINILIYGEGNNSPLNMASNCIGIVFLVMIIYKIIKVTYAYSKINTNKSNKTFKEEDNSRGKVINFNYYK